jgi:RHS repeat-associated protein
LYYVCTDRQGSITALLNPNGTVAEKYSYDAYGRRRNPLNWNDYNVPAPSLINRGYTGHEMLDGFGLINMNGRMYDPVIGRVLSPDKVVQAPGYTQSYNRYSYCMNNPLRYTDPSGWYTAAEINTAIDEMWSYDYGGSWTPGSGTVPYTASEGFGYYLTYNEANGWAAGSSMGSSLSSYFTSNASAVSALGLSNRVTNFDAGMRSWLLSVGGLFTNYQSFVNNKTFQLVVDGNNKVVYYNSTGFVVPVVSANSGGADNPFTMLDAAGGLLTLEDIYNNFIHNHKTYTTTKGVIRNIADVRSARAAQFASASKFVKRVGVLGTVLMTGQAYIHIFNDKATNLDWSDATIGTLGLVAAVVALSNPIGWVAVGITAIGYGVATYSTVRLGVDLYSTDL